jgi:hypothetical protein
MIPRLSVAPPSRRQVLQAAGAGFGMVALAGLLARQAEAAERTAKPLAPKEPHFKARAKRIIFVFMQGAISQVDTFEYKPQLQQDGDKPGPGGGTLTASRFKFQQYGETGSWFSELLPHMATHADKTSAAPSCRPTSRALASTTRDTWPT